MVAQEGNVGFVQYQHFGRKQKDGVIVYLFMGVEAPGK
jgi:hypothetical protein